ncbi:MAG: PQQ-dependent sugar dehydrogenase [Vicinamibacterales bacterium]
MSRPIARVLALTLSLASAVTTTAGLPPTITLQIADYAQAPVTGSFTGGTGNPGSLARINFLRQEPGTSGRFFVNDLNGPLYILDPKTRAFTTYLDFNGREGAHGLFDRLPVAAGFANGLITFQFDPAYLSNGRFYTLHLEDPTMAGSAMPHADAAPGLRLEGYSPTPPIPTPGPTARECVLLEWTDTNITNATFEGTAREVLRLNLNTRIHPPGDLIFNPTARRGDPDWRVLYMAAGDSGSGEEQSPVMRHNPQRLDTLVGKILRIIPDLAEHTGTSRLSANRRYRVPNDNPFASTPGARGEIWAYGLRNPHRLTWEVDPARPANNRLLAMTIGLHTWETVDVIRKGANYGYSEREGHEQLLPNNQTGPRPVPDRLPIRISDSVVQGTVVPRYPVLEYNHGNGFAIMGGFVYHGARLPALRGKFLFGDILTGRLWYADYADMLKADDGNPDTMAAPHEVLVQWNDPNDTPDAGTRAYPTMNPIVVAGYEARRRAAATSQSPMPARADIRFGLDASGEIFLLSKVDGMIRSVLGATGAPAKP